MYYIIGLGNPGGEYTKTRHNTGRIVLDDFIKKSGLELESDKKAKALRGKGKLGKESFEVIFPETFMNKSGLSAAFFVKSKKAAGNLIVFHDDIDLPLGGFKISFGRGSGGHKGVESVMRYLKTKDFTRFRVGIAGKTPKCGVRKPDVSRMNDFITGDFKPAELTEIKKTSIKASLFIEAFIGDGREKAMSLTYRP